MPLLPARMVNEYSYCPRLAYLEWVQGEWGESADTVDGRFKHRRVDKPGGDLPAPEALEEEKIHARSITLSSNRLGLIAKMDLVEAEHGQVVPVDYKRGRRPHVAQGAYEPERVQLCVQGLEGAAAAAYFGAFGGMIKRDDSINFAFDFTTRNRRPPTDPVNAMLSFAYSMLARAWSVTLSAVGFDPYRGYYHQPRYGRPALALDMMEPFRPLIADSTVLMAINNGEVRPSDFISTAGSVNLNSDGRKRFIATFERRLSQEVTHPLFGYRISYRRLLELQARLLARSLLGDIPEYPNFMTR